MSIKFLLLGGRGIWVFFWGGEGRFYFYGRGDFSEVRMVSEYCSASVSHVGLSAK